MGNFIISVIIIISIVIFTVWGSFAVCSNCEEFISLIKSDEIESAFALWEEKRGFISFFVRDFEIDLVTEKMKKLCDSSTESESAIEAIDEIINAEQINFYNLF